MSVDYAAGLSDYDDLGICSLNEVHDEIEKVEEKVKILTNLLRQYKGSCVVHVGAGLSTAAGIPDFRGKSGVWTKKLQNEMKSTINIETVKNFKKDKEENTTIQCNDHNDNDNGDDETNLKTKDIAKVDFKPFDETIPTYSHLALRELCCQSYISHIISQNVDGLFLKSNLAKEYISELHGNFYLDECTKCRARFIRSTASKSMRLQRSSIRCSRIVNSKQCIGYLRDTILDWESPIPYNELRFAQREAKRTKLHICIGTSMQLRPSKDLVCDPTRNKQTKLVVINLQPTQLDLKANLVINYYADEVMKRLAHELDLAVPQYDPSLDPTKQSDLIGTIWQRDIKR